ncbi:unnamed protein product, partial [Ixodes pacificus]
CVRNNFPQNIAVLTKRVFMESCPGNVIPQNKFRWSNRLYFEVLKFFRLNVSRKHFIIAPLQHILQHFGSLHLPAQCNTQQTMCLIIVFFSGNLWSDGETKVLLEYYTLYSHQIGPMRKFRTKKAMYDMTASKMKELLGTTRTGTQCETRFKTLMRTKKNQVDNNRKSGSTRCAVQYEQEFAAIAGFDDSVEPEVMRGVRSVVYKERAAVGATTSTHVAPMGPDEPSGSIPSTPSRREEAPRASEKRQNAADRSLRPSTNRMRHMNVFFEKMAELQKEKEMKKDEREKVAAAREARKEQRHQELLSAHREHIAAINRLLACSEEPAHVDC